MSKFAWALQSIGLRPRPGVAANVLSSCSTYKTSAGTSGRRGHQIGVWSIVLEFLPGSRIITTNEAPFTRLENPESPRRSRQSMTEVERYQSYVRVGYSLRNWGSLKSSLVAGEAPRSVIYSRITKRRNIRAPRYRIKRQSTSWQVASIARTLPNHQQLERVSETSFICQTFGDQPHMSTEVDSSESSSYRKGYTLG